MILPVFPRRNVVSVVALCLCGAVSTQALTINLNPNAALAANVPAFSAFQRAAATWESIFSDDVTVTIDAGLASLGAGVLGQAGSKTLAIGYGNLRRAMIADEAAEGSGADPVVAALPLPDDLIFGVNKGVAMAGFFGGTKANLKALGFSNLDAEHGESDGFIDFSSDFAFDYDRSDGIGAGLHDFESVALHEIGHTLGFVSGVDDVDVILGEQLDGIAVPRVMDLFRFSAEILDPESYLDFAFAPRSLVAGIESHMDFFDLEVPLSTGALTGDGRQASHWKDDGGLGLMDPTLRAGEIGALSVADIRSLDVIGWDVRQSVPDVGDTLGLLLGSCGALLGMRRFWAKWN